jgi:hypothetical protein
MWHRQVMAQGKSTYAVMDLNDDGQNPLGRHRHKQENNIKVEDTTVWCKDEDEFIRLRRGSNGVVLWRRQRTSMLKITVLYDFTPKRLVVTDDWRIVLITSSASNSQVTSSLART